MKAIALLEDAVHLLRQAPLATLVCHLTGSLPLALALLRYWNDITNPRTADATLALESALLALLLVWMNCWRAVFAGRLRRQLAGTPDPPWTGRRVWRLVCGQAFFGATRLPMMALASLVMFPLAATVAFYRTTTVLGDREDLDPVEVMGRARQLAVVEPRQSWALLPILSLLWLLVTLNLAVFLGILPQLVRMLTGYESAFSRSGSFFVTNPLFAMLVIAVSWIAFDPFVQAVYCVRAFRGESMATGEDLLAGLRALGRGAARGAAVLLLLVAMRASAAVSSGELEKSVHDTMQAHEYDWRLPPAPPSSAKSSWLLRLADHMIAGLQALGRLVREGIDRLIHWLTGQQAEPQPGTAPVSGLHWSVYLLTAVVIVAAIWIVWRKRQSRQTATADEAGASIGPIRLDADELTADRLPEETWLELAERSIREGQPRLALRALYLANLAWLGRTGLITIHPGKTNREYELELRRRARDRAEARGLFAQNIAAFEQAWYGMHDVAGDDLARFRARLDEMRRAAA